MVKLFKPLWPHSPVEIPSPFGTMTPNNPLSGASEAVSGLDWSGYGQGCAWIKTVDEHGNPIIEGEKPDLALEQSPNVCKKSPYSGV